MYIKVLFDFFWQDLQIISFIFIMYCFFILYFDYFHYVCATKLIHKKSSMIVNSNFLPIIYRRLVALPLASSGFAAVRGYHLQL